MKKKISIISIEYPPAGGGAGIVAQQLYLDSLKNEQIDYSYLFGDGKNDIFSRFFFDYKFYFNYKSELQSTSTSLFILNDLQAILLAGRLLPQSFLERSVCIIHGMNFNNYFHDSVSFNNKIRKYDKAYFRTIKNCRSIICVSHYIKEQFLLSFPDVSGKTRVIYCGISSNLQNVSLLKSKSIKFDTKYFHLLTVSRIIESKGFYKKLSLAKLLKDKNISFRWHIVGKGRELKKLQKLSVKFGLENEIIFHGYVNRNLLSEFYMNCDLFWLMPILPEAFGLVYLEAQSYGLSCIGSNLGGIKESINLDTGLVIDSNDENRIIDFISNFNSTKAIKESNVDFSLKFPSNALIGAFNTI